VVAVVQQMQLLAKGFTHASKKLRRMAQIQLGGPAILMRQSALRRLILARHFGNPIGGIQAWNAALHADRLEARLLLPRHVFEGAVDILAAGVGVDQHAVAALAAQQVIDRRIERLALDVPQCHVDGRNRRHLHRSAPPVAAAIKILPDVLGLKGIAANNAGKEMVGEATGDGQFAAI